MRRLAFISTRVAIALALPFLPHAEELPHYTLSYKNDNRWVAVEDNIPLRALIAAAKKKQSDITLTFTLPAAHKDINQERILILRDILRNNTGKNVHLHEATPAEPVKNNTITLQFDS